MLTLAAFAAAHLTPDITAAVIMNQSGADTPLIAQLLARGQIRRTAAERFQWGTDAHPARRTQIDNGGAAYDDATTSLDVDTSAPFYVDALVLCEATNELLLVTAITDANTIVVKRGVGGGVAAAAGSVANNAFLQVLGPANGEGSPLPAARQSAPTNNYNNVQTLRTPFGLTGRALRVETNTEDEKRRQRMKKFEEHMRDLERLMIHGGIDGGALTDSGSRRTTLTQGLRRAITTNVDAVGGTMTKARWFTACEVCFRNRTDLLFIVGPTLMQTIYTLYDNQYRIVDSQMTPGLKLTEVSTPFGLARLALSRTLTGTYAGEAIALDMAEVFLRYTEKDGNSGRTNLRQSQEAKGTDGQIDEWFSEMGIQWGGEFNHARITGVTGPA